MSSSVNTKETPGAFDALEKAAPDEPVFALCGRDQLAPDLVHLWAERRRAAIRDAQLPEGKRYLELAQCREADEIAFAMVEWRTGSAAAAVIPDEAAEAPRHPSGMGADELVAKARFDAVLAAARAIDNAVADLGTAMEGLTPLGDYGWQVELLDGAQDILRDLAGDLRPKRASYAHLAEPVAGANPA